jgi:hypothetical protein
MAGFCLDGKVISNAAQDAMLRREETSFIEETCVRGDAGWDVKQLDGEVRGELQSRKEAE